MRSKNCTEREREREGMGKILGFGIFCVCLFVIVLWVIFLDQICILFCRKFWFVRRLKMLFLGQLILFRTKNYGLVFWSKRWCRFFLGLIKNQFFFLIPFPKFWGPLPLGSLRQWPNWPSRMADLAINPNVDTCKKEKTIGHQC